MRYKKKLIDNNASYSGVDGTRGIIRDSLRESFKIVLIYVVFGGLWILFSDSLLDYFVSDAHLLITISKLKGWIYVLVTGIFLFQLIYKEIFSIQKLNRDMAQKNTELLNSNDEIHALYEEMAASEETLHESFNELQVYRDQLELKVEERTTDLRVLNQQLRGTNDDLVSALEQLEKTQYQLLQAEKAAALGGVIAGIAHEISTPIGIGVTSVSYMLKEIHEVETKLKEKNLSPSEFNDFVSECKEVIQGTARSLEKVDLLISGFQHISVDQTSEDKRRFKVRAYLDEFLISLSALFVDTAHQVFITCADELEINSYPGSLAQIVSSFITNSLRYGFDRHTAGTIKIDLLHLDGEIILTYQDDGKGMSDEVLKKIFDPFFTTKRGSQGGAGLGLYSVYIIVTQKLEGEIKCISELGKGAKFTIKFPYRDEEE